jgi:predicted RND superfamily exporter protein
VDVRARIEAAFTTLGYFTVRHRRPTIALTLLITAGLASWLPQMKVDNSTESFLHEDDPELLRYNDFRDRFDRDDRLVIMVHPPEIFELGFLETLRAFHEELETEVPYVEEVISLINARNTRGDRDELIVEDLLEDWPESAADVEEIRERVLSNPLYRNILISENARLTTVTLKPLTYSTLGGEGDVLAGFEEDDAPGPTEGVEPQYLTEAESHELVIAVRAIVARYQSPELALHISGAPAISYGLTGAMSRDVRVFMSLSLLVIAILLFVLFRTASGVVLPLIVVLSSLISSMGIMVWLGIPLSITLQILPSFLTVVGVCDSVHILVIVYQRLDAGSSKTDAIAFSLGHSGLAVVMTSLTTAAGLLSFSVAELAPIAYLGIIAPIGVMLAMVYSLVFLPALLAVTPLKAVRERGTGSINAMLTRWLVRTGDLVTRHPWRVLAVTGVVLAIGLGGVLQARFSHDAVEWFPEHEPLRIASDVMDREFKGAASLEVLIDTGRENGVKDPDTLNRIEKAMRHSETLEVGYQPVGKSISIVDIVKEIHQAMNENRPEHYVIPQDRPSIAQELLLFENSGSDDLEEVSDSQFSTARVTIRTPWVDAMLYPDFIAQIDRDFRHILGEDLDLQMTGMAVLFSRTFKAVIISMTRSYIFALIVIMPMLILLIGSLRRGIASMMLNLTPVFLVLGLMGWAGIPLDASTLLVGGIIIGLAVDDTIHFMHKFNRYFDDSGDARLAVQETLQTTGSALLFTSLVLSLGFSSFMFAYMVNGFQFGLLTSFACVVAFLADVIVAPALMILVTRTYEKSGDQGPTQ